MNFEFNRILKYFLYYMSVFVMILTGYDLFFEEAISWVINLLSGTLFGAGLTFYRVYRR